MTPQMKNQALGGTQPIYTPGGQNIPGGYATGYKTYDNLSGVELIGFQEAAAGFKAAPEIIAKHARLRLQAYARQYVTVMREEAPLGMTGKLRAGIKYRIAEAPSIVTATIYSEQWYTMWVVNGRGDVYPIKARCLHWIDKAGNDVFRMHAGPSKPNPFPTRAKNRMMGEYYPMALGLIDGVVKDIARATGSVSGGTSYSGATGAVKGASNFGDAFSRMTQRLAGETATFFQRTYK